MEPRYILFDMDGVLINSARSILETTEYTLSQFGRTLREEDRGKIIGPPLQVIYEQIFGFEPEVADEAIRIYKKYYDEHALGLIEAFPGVEEMLQTLLGHDKKLLVATARYVEVSEKILESLNLRQYFCFVGGVNAPVGRNIPGGVTTKSEVINYCLTENGILDRECAIMVGDRQEDIRGGKENGLLTIGALYGYGSREELLLSGADYLATDPLNISRHIIEDF